MFLLLHQYYVLEILASINIQVNQTSPPTLLKVVVGYDIFGTFIPITSTNNTTVTNINVPGLGGSNLHR